MLSCPLDTLRLWLRPEPSACGLLSALRLPLLPPFFLLLSRRRRQGQRQGPQGVEARRVAHQRPAHWPQGRPRGARQEAGQAEQQKKKKREKSVGDCVVFFPCSCSPLPPFPSPFPSPAVPCAHYICTRVASCPKVVSRDRQRLEDEGLSQVSFTLGVLNIAFTAFVCGRFPEYFWLWHTLKSVSLTSLQVGRPRDAGTREDMTAARRDWRRASSTFCYCSAASRPPAPLPSHKGLQVVWPQAAVLHARPLLGHHLSRHPLGRDGVLHRA